MYALWYPLKDPGEVGTFVTALADAGISRVLRAELTIRKPSTPPRLYGSGMIVVNPPFTLEDELKVLLPALADVLADAGRGGWTLEWIRGE
jgi:23S rRNA (adenine2030-N6)-methyltransferase